VAAATATPAEPGPPPVVPAQEGAAETEEAVVAAAAVSPSVAVSSVRLGAAPTAASMRDELLSIRRLLTP
jgi:hypothetical protein